MNHLINHVADSLYYIAIHLRNLVSNLLPFYSLCNNVKHVLYTARNINTARKLKPKHTFSSCSFHFLSLVGAFRLSTFPALMYNYFFMCTYFIYIDMASLTFFLCPIVLIIVIADGCGAGFVLHVVSLKFVKVRAKDLPCCYRQTSWTIT